MITYKNVLDSNHDMKMVRVYSDGRFAGTIEQTRGLGKDVFWRYSSSGKASHQGPLLDSVVAVKKTLQGD